MKKELIFLLAAAALGTVCFSNLTAGKVSAKTGGDFQYTVNVKDKKTCSIRKYTGKANNVTVPSKINGYKVTRIGDMAFAGNSKIRSVKLPKKVTSIGKKAFTRCKNLKKINLPDNITTIGTDAFYDCGKLTIPAVPAKLKKAGAYAFMDCKVKKFTFTSNMKELDKEAFTRCDIGEFTISRDVDNFDSDTLWGVQFDKISVDNANKKYDSRDNCNALIETATNTLLVGSNTTAIPSTVTAIDKDAFSNCDRIKEIYIPDSVKTIGERAFFCTGLEKINIPKDLQKTDLLKIIKSDSLSSISVSEGNPFYDSRDNCNGVIDTESNLLVLACKNTVIPATVKAIDSFAYMTTPLELIIPEGVVNIENWAFKDIKTLEKITLPSSLNYIGKDAFRGCENLREVNIQEGLTIIGDGSFFACDKLEKITLPSTLVSIGWEAFSDCDSLTEIYIPKNVKNIDFKSAFNNCFLLERITIDPENQYFKSEKNGLKVIERSTNKTIFQL